MVLSHFEIPSSSSPVVCRVMENIRLLEFIASFSSLVVLSLNSNSYFSRFRYRHEGFKIVGMRLLLKSVQMSNDSNSSLGKDSKSNNNLPHSICIFVDMM